MTKEEFLLEATLRLLSTRPQATMEEILGDASYLTKITFIAANACNIGEPWWGNKLDKTPIQGITNVSRCGAALERIFEENEIKTIGDLLRIGSVNFKSLKGVGIKAFNSVWNIMEEDFGIKAW